MRNSIEIEFKTKLSQEKYEELLQKLELNDKIFPQTNFYFDTINGDLERQKIVLRIRKKEKYKLTSKMTNPNDLDSTLETHLELTDSEAIDMLKNGFNASIINLNYDCVWKKTEKQCREKVHTEEVEAMGFSTEWPKSRLDSFFFRSSPSYRVQLSNL